MGNPLHFIQASDTSGLTALCTDQGALPGQYAALQAHLKALGLERWGTLWAEPVTGQSIPTGYASISWYTPLEGVGTPLSRLDADEAEQVRTELRRAREALAPHLDDSPGGAFLRKALFIPSADAVFVVNGRPVLVNWGLLPPGTDEATAPVLWGETSASAAPDGKPPLSSAGTAAFTASPLSDAAGSGSKDGNADQAAASATGIGAAGAATAATAVPTAGVARHGRWGLLAALLIGFMLGALLLLLLRSCAPQAPEPPPPPPPPAPESPQDAARKAERDTLLREKAFWQGLLELTPCELRAFFAANGDKAPTAAPDGQEAMPAPPEHTLPQSPAPDGLPGLRLPPLPDANATAPTPSIDPAALTLPQRMERGTVLILAPVPGGAQQGTGFFINADHVLTNRHVVANAIDGMAIVTNTAMSGARRGKVVAVSDAPGYDFAVLRVALAAGDGVLPLPLCAAIGRTDKVSAWGFPALISEQDPAYLRLLQGDFTAVPEVTYTDGVVNAILQTEPRNIVHSAVVSQGNSGGPLVNGKGQAVGINTFIRLDVESNRQTQTALGSDAIMAFLREKGIAFTEEQ